MASILLGCKSESASQYTPLRKNEDGNQGFFQTTLKSTGDGRYAHASVITGKLNVRLSYFIFIIRGHYKSL
jgi:hypothetical protein